MCAFAEKEREKEVLSAITPVPNTREHLLFVRSELCFVVWEKVVGVRRVKGPYSVWLQCVWWLCIMHSFIMEFYYAMPAACP